MPPRLRFAFFLGAVLLAAAPLRAQLAEAAPTYRGDVRGGAAVFRANCRRCHGVNADGRSDMARVLRPAPANLLASRLDAEQKERVVRLGGPEALGRNSVMPSWNGVLSERQIKDVIAYVQELGAGR